MMLFSSVMWIARAAPRGGSSQFGVVRPGRRGLQAEAPERAHGLAVTTAAPRATRNISATRRATRRPQSVQVHSSDAPHAPCLRKGSTATSSLAASPPPPSSRIWVKSGPQGTPLRPITGSARAQVACASVARSLPPRLLAAQVLQHASRAPAAARDGDLHVRAPRPPSAAPWAPAP